MNLIELLPEYYKNSEEVTRLQDAISHWADLIEENSEDILLQLNVNTATWGLEYWEKQYGIVADITKSVELRRERIKAKVRGTGTVTKEMIKSVAKSYSNGEVEVIEDSVNYSFVIKFTNSIGIPENIEDLILTIKEIKPAHLSITFEYTYRTHAVLSQYTHAQLSAYTHAQLREGMIS